MHIGYELTAKVEEIEHVIQNRRRRNKVVNRASVDPGNDEAYGHSKESGDYILVKVDVDSIAFPPATSPPPLCLSMAARRMRSLGTLIILLAAPASAFVSFATTLAATIAATTAATVATLGLATAFGA